MARDSDGIIQIKYANSGDVGLGGLDLNELWPISYSTPGGQNPQRIQFNQLFRFLSALAVEINQEGPFLEYNATINYAIKANVLGSDGKVYKALAANGPATSVINPVGNPATWFDVFSAIGILFDDSFVPYTATTVQAAFEASATATKLAISGMVISNDVTDIDHDIEIATGQARDFADSRLLTLSAALTKQIDAVWAAGDDAGGMFTGAVSADTFYYLFVIRKDSDGSMDAGFDIDSGAANIPAGYTAYRRVGHVVTDGSANILNFQAIETPGGGLDISYAAMIEDLNATVLNTRQLLDVTVPVNCIGRFGIHFVNSSASIAAWIKSTSFTDVAAAIGGAANIIVDSSAGSVNSVEQEINVDSNNQIAWRASASAGVTLNIQTQGYLDTRKD